MLNSYRRRQTSTTASPPPTNETIHPIGHFYNAKECDDCIYKGAQCGCQPAMEYFACLTKHCQPAGHPSFSEKCAVLWSNCSADLDIDCRGPQTVCHSKFHQAPTGGLGMTVKVNKDKGYCGPFGKCIGKIKFKIELVKPGEQVTQAGQASSGPVPAPAPAPVAVPTSISAVGAVAAPAPTSIDVSAAYSAQVWLECGIPKKVDAHIDNKKDWKICQKQVKENKAKCRMRLFKELEVGDEKKGYCVLTDGKDGKRLSQPYWTIISNAHDNEVAVTETQNVQSEEDQAKADKRAAALKAERAKIAEDTQKVEQVYQSAKINNERRKQNFEARSNQEFPAPTTTGEVVYLPPEFKSR